MCTLPQGTIEEMLLSYLATPASQVQGLSRDQLFDLVKPNGACLLHASMALRELHQIGHAVVAAGTEAEDPIADPEALWTLTSSPEARATMKRETLVRKVGNYTYHPDDILGRGRMGQVVRARHEYLKRDVAIKFLAREYTEKDSFRQRFDREARILARLDHPNIVRVYDAGRQDDGTYYLAMELVESGTLLDLTKKLGRLPPHLVVRHMFEVASALAAAHAHGIHHRDVKPENVMMTPAAGAKLTDFNLATVDEAGVEKSPSTFGSLAIESSKIAQMVGTLPYIAPERANRERGDERSDVYSLGATFYTVSAGGYLFENLSTGPGGTMDWLWHHVKSAPKPLIDRVPGFPEALAAIIHRCLAKDPTQRYQTYDDLLRDLAQVRSEIPVVSEGPDGAPRATVSVVTSNLLAELESSMVARVAAYEAKYGPRSLSENGPFIGVLFDLARREETPRVMEALYRSVVGSAPEDFEAAFIQTLREVGPSRDAAPWTDMTRYVWEPLAHAGREKQRERDLLPDTSPIEAFIIFLAKSIDDPALSAFCQAEAVSQAVIPVELPLVVPVEPVAASPMLKPKRRRKEPRQSKRLLATLASCAVILAIIALIFFFRPWDERRTELALQPLATPTPLVEPVIETVPEPPKETVVPPTPPEPPPPPTEIRPAPAAPTPAQVPLEPAPAVPHAPVPFELDLVERVLLISRVTLPERSAYRFQEALAAFENFRASEEMTPWAEAFLDAEVERIERASGAFIARPLFPTEEETTLFLRDDRQLRGRVALEKDTALTLRLPTGQREAVSLEAVAPATFRAASAVSVASFLIRAGAGDARSFVTSEEEAVPEAHRVGLVDQAIEEAFRFADRGNFKPLLETAIPGELRKQVEFLLSKRLRSFEEEREAARLYARKDDPKALAELLIVRPTTRAGTWAAREILKAFRESLPADHAYELVGEAEYLGWANDTVDSPDGKVHFDHDRRKYLLSPGTTGRVWLKKQFLGARQGYAVRFRHSTPEERPSLLTLAPSVDFWFDFTPRAAALHRRTGDGSPAILKQVDLPRPCFEGTVTLLPKSPLLLVYFDDLLLFALPEADYPHDVGLKLGAEGGSLLLESIRIKDRTKR